MTLTQSSTKSLNMTLGEGNIIETNNQEVKPKNKKLGLSILKQAAS